MTTDQMRKELEEVYPGPKWRLRCQTMKDRQVIAIYKNLKEQGKLRKINRKHKKQEPGIIAAFQITMFDIAPELFSPQN